MDEAFLDGGSKQASGLSRLRVFQPEALTDRRIVNGKVLEEAKASMLIYGLGLFLHSHQREWAVGAEGHCGTSVGADESRWEMLRFE